MATRAASAAGVSGSNGVPAAVSSRLAARLSWESAATGDPVTDSVVPRAISDSTPLSNVGALPDRPGAAGAPWAGPSAPIPISTGTATSGCPVSPASASW